MEEPIIISSNQLKSYFSYFYNAPTSTSSTQGDSEDSSKPQYPPDVEIIERKVPGYDRAWLVAYKDMIFLLHRDYMGEVWVYPSNRGGQKLTSHYVYRCSTYKEAVWQMCYIYKQVKDDLQYKSEKLSTMTECGTFYVLEALLAPDRSYKGIAAGRLLLDLQEAQAIHTHNLAWALADYLTLAAFGEARHARTRCKSHRIDLYPCYDSDRSSSYKYAREYDPLSSLPTLVSLFTEGSWEGGWGGNGWGEIAETAYMFRSGELPAEAFIDRCWDLAHNGGPCFDKPTIFDPLTGDRKPDFRRLLDAKGFEPLESWGRLYLPIEIRRLLERAWTLEVAKPGNIILDLDGYGSLLRGYEPIKFGDRKLGDIVARDPLFGEDEEEDEEEEEDAEPSSAPTLVGLNWVSKLQSDQPQLYNKLVSEAKKLLDAGEKDTGYYPTCNCESCKKMSSIIYQLYTEQVAAKIDALKIDESVKDTVQVDFQGVEKLVYTKLSKETDGSKDIEWTVTAPEVRDKG